MRTKHKIAAHVFVDFVTLWDALLSRLEQAGEVIVRTKITLDGMCGPLSGYRATVWTGRKEGGSK